METQPTKFEFLTTCVEVPTEQVDHLFQMMEMARAVSVSTFRRHTNWKPVARSLGYAVGRHAKGLRMEQDYHLGFYRSTWKGAPCYYLDHSRIEHIFVQPAGADQAE
ncbi:hypothetical protein [Rubrivivax gelatinosus]|uniref:hypothetical protein n=1 Tax=Rubrivivax gelatinosus TaxID=28068 RepID=UPI0005C17379|nr:hypothetical protein [Rubrivivax gelatinosus]MBG6082986.1 hypothetical protein [Rubrivivax gelatinosus]